MNNDIINWLGNDDKQQSLYDYFVDIKEAGYGMDDILVKNLKALEGSGFMPDKLTEVICSLSRYIKDISKQDRDWSKHLYKILRDNVEAWVDTAQVYMDTGIEQGENGFTRRRLLNAGHAISSLGLHPGDAFVKDYSKMLAHHLLPVGKPQDVLQAAHILAIFEALSPNLELRRAGRKLLTSINGLPPESLAGRLNPLIRLSRYFDLHEPRLPVPEENNERVSNSEQRLTSQFRRVAGPISLRTQMLIASIGHYADYMFEKDGNVALVELDGPSHFTGRGLLNGNSYLMTELLSRLHPDWVIIRLPYTVPSLWHYSGDKADGLRRDFMNAALEQGSGTYLYSGIYTRFVPLAESAKAKDFGYTQRP